MSVAVFLFLNASKCEATKLCSADLIPIVLVEGERHAWLSSFQVTHLPDFIQRGDF